MSHADVLNSFVKDALASGADREAVRATLISSGWPLHQVELALGEFDGVAFGVPVPSSRQKERPNAWFFLETGSFAAEVFQIVEWLVVTVAVRYAAVRTGSALLNAVFVALFLLLTAYVVSRWVKFEWWLWPSLDKRGLRGMRKAFHVAFTLAAVYGIHMIVVTTADLLLQLQAKS